MLARDRTQLGGPSDAHVAELQRLEQTILYQGNTIDIAIEDGQTRVRAGRRMAQELEYRYREQLYRLAPGNAQVHHREEPPPSE